MKVEETIFLSGTASPTKGRVDDIYMVFPCHAITLIIVCLSPQCVDKATNDWGSAITFRNTNKSFRCLNREMFHGDVRIGEICVNKQLVWDNVNI